MIHKHATRKDHSLSFVFGLKRSEAEAIWRELGQLQHSVGGLSNSATRLLAAIQERRTSEITARRSLPSSYWA